MRERSGAIAPFAVPDCAAVAVNGLLCLIARLLGIRPDCLSLEVNFFCLHLDLFQLPNGCLDGCRRIPNLGVRSRIPQGFAGLISLLYIFPG